jgi:hypothetical protein
VKILNLYAGIGGNRKLWTDAVESLIEWGVRIAQNEEKEDKVKPTELRDILSQSYALTSQEEKKATEDIAKWRKEQKMESAPVGKCKECSHQDGTECHLNMMQYIEGGKCPNFNPAKTDTPSEKDGLEDMIEKWDRRGSPRDSTYKDLTFYIKRWIASKLPKERIDDDQDCGENNYSIGYNQALSDVRQALGLTGGKDGK